MRFQKIIKRLFDFLLSLIAFFLLVPIYLIASIGIIVSDGFPIIYKAKRMGKNMSLITVYKFRTMRVDSDKEGAITGINDKRVFCWGKILRKTKIDELPQLINILRGNMSIVGPRPEDVNIVEKYYSDKEKETLKVLPGLSCPGSIFNYTHGDMFLKENNSTEETYANDFLHTKLALDIYYLDHWNILYDLKIILRTIYVIFAISIFRIHPKLPKEYIKVFNYEK